MSALKAKLSDLLLALEMASDEIIMRFDRQLGQIVSVDGSLFRQAEDGEDEDFSELPDWQQEEVKTAREILEDDGSRFIDPPDKFEFHEYRQMERFIGTVENQRVAEELWRAIKGKGAFRYFKDTLHRHGIEEQWYRFRDTAMKEFVIAWANDNNVEFMDDVTPRTAKLTKKREAAD